MATLLVIADDFTGALDTGVKFAEKGASVRVIADYNYDFAITEDSVQVLVLNAETRHESKETAFARIYQIVIQARQAGISFLYKKTDSALRGNIGSELSAALAASGNSILHFIPAFPQMGRTTRNGIHYVNNVPVNESVFGQDPYTPVKYAAISQIINEQSDVPVRIISDTSIIVSAESPVIAVYDTQNDSDLQALSLELYKRKQLNLLSGCAGLAEYLPEALNLTGNAPLIPKLEKRFTIVCGSINPVTKAQLDYAERHGFIRIRLTAQEKLEAGFYHTPRGKEKLMELINKCFTADRCILDTNDEDGQISTLDNADSYHLTTEALRTQISSTLGFLVKNLLEHDYQSTFLITGGDSLLGVMEQLNVSVMSPICELAPGTVLSQFRKNGTAHTIISKSGGFGSETLFSELADFLDATG